jgi:hypothetical protein
MTGMQLYYLLKPLLPRRLQLAMRKVWIARKRSMSSDIWPINKNAGIRPAHWRGWPDGKKFALVLTHDVETEKGQRKTKQLADLERSLGFRSSFNFVPKRYHVQPEVRKYLIDNNFEVGVHGLYHDGKYYSSREVFLSRAQQINHFLKEWGAVGFRSPSMLHNLEWIHDLDIEYDTSTFDTDPFEPQSDGVGTIFPFFVRKDGSEEGYVELPYTLAQDFTLLVLMKERDITVWKQKLDWIVGHEGMALLNTHPDYMNFGNTRTTIEEYPVIHYLEFLQYVKSRYNGTYWSVLPRDLARFFRRSCDQK